MIIICVFMCTFICLLCIDGLAVQVMSEREAFLGVRERE
jgi:hypothetical protein